ncbi:MAG: STAS domain-containing protein [Ignavibacteriales bacterium]|nr:STAS domain-containing protein [Ignavibacteriales bacterium]MBK7379380.1 STAS domain-containing protein [Ignavibacteriales bacterium]
MKNISLKRIDDVCIISILNERATLNISEELNSLILDCSPVCSDMIIDLSICNFIDSTFIGNLISVSKKLKENKTNLFLIKPEKEAFQIIVRMGVKEVFNFLESPADLLRRK